MFENYGLGVYCPTFAFRVDIPGPMDRGLVVFDHLINETDHPAALRNHAREHLLTDNAKSAPKEFVRPLGKL